MLGETCNPVMSGKSVKATLPVLGSVSIPNRAVHVLGNIIRKPGPRTP